MNDDEFRRQRRNEARFARFGTRTPRCPCCGETRPACFDAHHVAGREHNELTVLTCVNCHRVLTDMQKDRRNAKL